MKQVESIYSQGKKIHQIMTSTPTTYHLHYTLPITANAYKILTPTTFPDQLKLTNRQTISLYISLCMLSLNGIGTGQDYWNSINMLKKSPTIKTQSLRILESKLLPQLLNN